jgi:uncharacterized protein YciI
MPYLIVTYDKPDHGLLRQQTRPEHLTFLELNKAKLLACGAKLDDLGASASGGIYILDTDDRQEAESFIANDPFTKAGLFERVERVGVRPISISSTVFPAPKTAP